MNFREANVYVTYKYLHIYIYTHVLIKPQRGG